MPSPKIWSVSSLFVLAHALPAQAPPDAVPTRPLPAAVDVTRGAGLQPDGPGRLFGGGTDYAVWLSKDGMRFVPALGRAAEYVRYVELRPLEVRRGEQVVASRFTAAPDRAELCASYRHAPAITECFDVGEDGVEVSWRFESRPAGDGDLVVRYRLDSNLPLSENLGTESLRFVQEGLGGVTIGGVTGIDARGRRTAGALSYADGVLEMSLPDAFVDGASYPIVLDPLVGPESTVFPPGYIQYEPDISYDASTQQYLVVWSRELAATLVLPRARFVDATSATPGAMVLLGAAGVCGRPRIANHPSGDRFGVVFEERDGMYQGIQFRVIDAATATISHVALIASSMGVDLFRHPDICGSVHSGNPAFAVVYEDNIQNAIRARRITFGTSDQMTVHSPVSIWTNTTGAFGATYSEPAIARLDGLVPWTVSTMIVAKRSSGLGPLRSVVASVLSVSSLSTLASASLGSTTSDIVMPDVDGSSGNWVVAWGHVAGSVQTVQRVSVRYDGAALTVGTIESLGGGSLQQVKAPSVGWSKARTWLGYHYTSVGPQRSLRVAAVDSADCTWGGSEFSETMTTTDTRIVVATDASGGVVGGNDAMAAYAHGDAVLAQKLIGYGNGGTFQNLGGHCGNGGAQSFSHAPGIGSSIVFHLTGASPTALISVFNITPDLLPIACGLCEWAPFAITDIRLVAAGAAAVPFVLPMHPTLIGSQWITQWTTYDPSESPCALLPEFVLTDRTLMTIGN